VGENKKITPSIEEKFIWISTKKFWLAENTKIMRENKELKNIRPHKNKV
jgi:hypothetical protein